MRHTIGAYEAKTRLPELLDRVANGDVVTITRHGIPVAELGPPPPVAGADIDTVIEALISYSRAQGRTLGTSTIRQLIEEGRRY
jgi:prevent-host-death family protein